MAEAAHGGEDTEELVLQSNVIRRFGVVRIGVPERPGGQGKGESTEGVDVEGAKGGVEGFEGGVTVEGKGVGLVE